MNLSSKISKLFLRVHDKEEKKKRIEKKGKEKQSPMGKFRNENNPPRGTVSPALYPSLPDSLWLDASPCPSTPTLLSGYFARFNLARLSVSAKLRWRKEPPATRSSCIPVVPENHVRPFPTCDEGLQVSVRLREQDRLPFASPPRINTRFSSRLNKIIELATLWRKIASFHSTHVSFYITIQIKSCQISTWNFVEIVLDGTSRSSSINRTVGNRESGVRKEGRSDRKNLRRGIEKRGKREERRIDRQRVERGLENFLPWNSASINLGRVRSNLPGLKKSGAEAAVKENTHNKQAGKEQEEGPGSQQSGPTDKKRGKEAKERKGEARRRGGVPPRRHVRAPASPRDSEEGLGSAGRNEEGEEKRKRAKRKVAAVRRGPSTGTCIEHTGSRPRPTTWSPLPPPPSLRFSPPFVSKNSLPCSALKSNRIASNYIQLGLEL